MAIIIQGHELSLKYGIIITKNGSKKDTKFADGKYEVVIPAGQTGHFKPKKIGKKGKEHE